MSGANQPPGYNQGSRPVGPQMRGPQYGPPPGQYAPPPAFPQYGPGMYPPPQQSGMPTWAIVLIVGGIVGIFFVFILALAAIPLIASNTVEARSSEARAALGAMKDRARVVYQRTGTVPQSRSDLGITTGELRGAYFSDSNYSCGGTTNTWKASCSGVYDQAPRDLELTANLITGISNYNR